MPYEDAPAFYRWLKTKTGVAPLALRFLILTVARTSEVRLAEFSEFEGKVWHLRSERTKSGKPHRVPLTDEATEIVDVLRGDEPGRYLFQSYRGNPMSDMAMSAFMKREGYTSRPHGFRATFRTWVEEKTNTPFEVKETCLGHQVGSEVERAYQRSDLLERRHKLLIKWTQFLTK